MSAGQKVYDFYADMLETHSEIGYLLVILVALLTYNGAVAIAIWRYPADDVYLVPGVEACGVADVSWGTEPPMPLEAAPAQGAATTMRADLEAGAAHAKEAGAPIGPAANDPTSAKPTTAAPAGPAPAATGK